MLLVTFGTGSLPLARLDTLFLGTHQMLYLLSSRIMPRTTIDIDASILDELKRVQKKEGASLGTVVSSLVAEALAARKEEHPATRRLRWVSRPMQARVAIEDKEVVWTALEGRKERPRA